MRRPNKTFVVEVKRARKGAVAKILGAEPHKIEADLPSKERQTRLTSPEPEATSVEAAPPRRILEAIAPPEAPAAPEPATELPEPAPILAVLTPRRPRGRPPKTAAAASLPATQKPRVVAEERPRAAGRKPRAVVEDQPRAVAKARLVPVARPKPEAVVVAIPAPVVRLASSAPGPTPHVTHGDRTEAASSLPRGERWKRRLPKVLW